jgi:hypothetical protein
MFHNHMTQRHVYITANKLRLNKLLQSPTYLASNRCPPAMCDSRQRTPELLQMFLGALVSTKSQAVEAAKCCQTQAHAGHETARISFRPPDTSYRLS